MRWLFAVQKQVQTSGSTSKQQVKPDRAINASLDAGRYPQVEGVKKR
jgi:hypothetical protein